MRLGALTLAAVVAGLSIGDARAQNAPTLSPGPASTGGVNPRALPPAPNGPLSGLGKKLSDLGIYPALAILEFAYAPQSAGQTPYRSQGQYDTIIDAGFDWEFGPMFGLTGTSLHFRDLYVPYVSDQRLGSKQGGILAAGNVFIPVNNHLQRITVKQDIPGTRAYIEVGKSNAGDYMALPICNTDSNCQSTLKILQNQAGFNPPPYSNYSARASATLTPSLRTQVGFWKVDNMYPFSDGYELRLPRREGNLVVLDAIDRTDFDTQIYPHRVEALYFHNASPQIDPLTRVVRSHTDGFFGSASQVIWRADPHLDGNLHPTYLSAFASGIVDFDNHTSQGVANTVDFGLIATGIFPGRAFDSYSIQGTFVQLTPSLQSVIQQRVLAATGVAYNRGPTERAISASASFLVGANAVFKPYATVVFNNTLFGAANYRQTQNDGFTIGATLVIFGSKALGFDRSAYNR